MFAPFSPYSDYDLCQGVYALFFFKRRVRSVGHRLAGSMGKLRYSDMKHSISLIIIDKNYPSR